jgi:hypothetical protein
MKNLEKGEVLILRTCAPDGSSYCGQFKWPKSGPVKCDDFKPTVQCGNGLHGLKWGVGDGSLLEWGDAAWVVARVIDSDCIDLGGKVKFPAAVVEFFGERFAAVALIAEHAPAGSAIVSGTATAGYSGTATAGDRGTATAGDRGTATAGDSGTATAGVRGTATAGDSGTATAGYSGTATAGDRGTATAGEDGAIAILYWNGKAYKRAIFAVGENNIKPNTPYHVKNGIAVEGYDPEGASWQRHFSTQ